MRDSLVKHKMLLITLWGAVLFNMLFADVFSIMVELTEGGVVDIPMDITTMMAVAALLTNIPISMLVLSWVLPQAANRYANMGAALFTALYVVLGGVLLPHYLIIGTVEVVLLIIIFRTSFRRK